MITESGRRIRDTFQGAVLEINVHPRVKRTAITRILDGRVKLALALPPVDGRAIEELERFFAALFDVSRSTVKLVGGEHTRDKRVLTAEQNRAAIVTAIERKLAVSKTFVS